jgi:hypothetical protein
MYKMSELTLTNNLEAHEGWLCEASRRLKMHYGDARQFSRDNNINYLSVFWFLKGNPIVDSDFKAICDVLDFDWKTIQHDPWEPCEKIDKG